MFHVELFRSKLCWLMLINAGIRLIKVNRGILFVMGLIFAACQK